MTTAPLLALPDFSQHFQLEIDASKLGIGMVLSQQGCPLAYFSQKSSPRMQDTSTYHREMFAIMQSMKKWQHYLLGHRFDIIIDKTSLRELVSQMI